MGFVGMRFNRIIGPTEHFEMWCASSHGFSFVISSKSRNDHDGESDYKISIGRFVVGSSFVIGIVVVGTFLVVPIFEWALSYPF